MRPHIDTVITSQWNGGYVMEVFITNNGTDALQDYRVGFDLPGSITDIWDGIVATQAGDRYVIIDDDSKNDIAPGETVRFKFKALTDSGAMPSRFTVNGEAASLDGEDTPDSGDSQPQRDMASDDVTTDGDVTHVGTGISAAKLQALIDDAPAGATIQLAAGEYRFDDPIAITRSDVALVGAGSGTTHITFTGSALDKGGANGFLVEGTDTEFAGTLRRDADEGSNTLSLGSGHGLQAGDTVRIWQDNTSEYFDAIGDTSWREMSAPLRTSMAKVVAASGDSVTLDRGVHFDFEAGAGKVERIDALENVTLQGFTVGYELGTPDKANFSNTRSDLTDYQAIKLDGTVNALVRDIEVLDGPSTAFEFARSLDLAADQLGAHGAFNKGTGGNGYAFELRESYDGVLTNLEDTGMRHSLLFASWRSSVGNEAHVLSTDRDINFHGGQDHGNTVHVERSIRDPDADGMSTTLWYNNGGHSYGAITEAGANRVTFEYVVGSRRDDVLHGSDDGVYLDGGLGHDRLYGGTGDDILSGGGGWGKNLLDGGKGFDTALFGLAFDEYRIRFDDDGSVYLDGDSDDTLHNMEQAIFADGTILDLATGKTSQGPAPTVPSVEEIITAPHPEPEPASPLRAEFETVSRWDGGYVMAIKITNASSSAIENPQVGFTLDADITQFYGASLLEQSGDAYTVAYDGSTVLKPDATMRFSFKAYAPTSELPQALALNGEPLELDAGTHFDTYSILDFTADEGGLIDLSAIDADLGTPGNQAFVWRGADAFTGSPGELRSTGEQLQGDVNGDGVVDLEIQLTGIDGPSVDDLVL